MKRTAWLVLSVLPVALLGCGSSADEPREKVSRTECENTLSGYDGDCLALPAPDPSRGFQLHFGPSNYDDQADVARFLLAPGEEKVTCLYMTTPNEEDVFTSGYDATVRPGTHHMIIWGGSEEPNPARPPDGTLTDECTDNAVFMVGAQNGMAEGGRIQLPRPGQAIAPENLGMASKIGAKTRIAFQTHYVNRGREPLLRESWANFTFRPKEEVTQVLSPLFWIGGLNMNVPAKTRQVIGNQCANDTGERKRLVSLVGHMHAHATRFSAWKVAAGSDQRQLVYEDFDWAHASLFYYDSVNQNPKPSARKRSAGAASGELVLEPGDRIEWECEVNNTSNQPLKFADQAYTAEMCNLFGSAVPGVGGAWNCFGG